MSRFSARIIFVVHVPDLNQIKNKYSGGPEVVIVIGIALDAININMFCLFAWRYDFRVDIYILQCEKCYRKT